VRNLNNPKNLLVNSILHGFKWDVNKKEEGVGVMPSDIDPL
jgi:hypothetical protein